MMMLDPNTVQVLFADLQPQIVARSKTNTPDASGLSRAIHNIFTIFSLITRGPFIG